MFEKFLDFEKFVHIQTGNNIKVLRSDNGGEYTSEEFRKHTEKQGIIHEFSSPYIHEQNGRAEREMRTIVESARTLLISSGVDLELWPEAVNSACYVLNRTILKQREMMTPFEKWFSRKPDIKHLRVFGTDAYLNIPKEKRKKFDPKSRKMIIVGYNGESTNYRLWDKDSRKIYVSSDVDFNEKSTSHSEQPENRVYHHRIEFGLPEESDTQIIDDEADHQQPIDVTDPDQQTVDEVGEDRLTGEQQQQQIDLPDETQGRRLRDRTRLNVIDRYGVSVSYIADTVPMTYTEAMSSTDAEKWKKAVQEEFKALEENHTWSVVQLPTGKSTIGCKWVFAIKRNATDNRTRYKARLVAKGFSQRKGIDYFETFATVVRYESIRILLAIAAKEDLEIAKFDVKTAFLYGNLEEEIYLRLPEGYTNEDNNGLVCKLRKSLYGLKQSPRCWNEKFVEFLKNFSFKNILSDKCVFIGVVKQCIVYLALYVDDGLVISESQCAIDEVLRYLKNVFSITTDLANEFVGMEMERDRQNRKIKISQSNYIDKIISKFCMNEAYPVTVPAEPGLHLSKKTNVCETDERIPYREAVGSLLFAARVCRPDIEYAVNYASVP